MDKHDDGKKAIQDLIIGEIVKLVSDESWKRMEKKEKISSPFDIIGDSAIFDGRVFTTELPEGFGKRPYETLIHHRNYGHDGDVCNLICVEAYDDRDQAMLGHERWIKELKGSLPKKLKDIKNELMWGEDQEELVYFFHESRSKTFH